MPLQKHNYETRKFLPPPAGEVAQMQLYFYTRCESGRCFFFLILFFSTLRGDAGKKIDFRAFKVLQAPHDPAVWVLLFFLFFFFLSYNMDNNSS